MATKWQISFKTLNNKSAVVSIDDATYSGTPIALQPAASPFSISRKQADIMSPVMSETGYLHIIDNGIAAHDIESIFPAGALNRPVTLTINGNVAWRGYISPESYSTDYNAAPCTVDLAVVGLLDVLETVNIVNTNVGLKSIGGFIAEILTATGQSWSNVIVARQIQRIYKREDRVIHQYSDIPEFRMLLSRFNFLDVNSASVMDDANWTPFIGKSYHDVLAEICRYFGWTASMQGNDLVLSSARNDISTYTQVAVSELQKFDMSSDATVTTSSRNTCFVEWDGTSHRKSISNGRKRITITTELNSGNDIVPQISFNGNEIGTFQEDVDIEIGQISEHTNGYMKVLSSNNENVQLHAYRKDSISEAGYHEITWVVPTDADDIALPAAFIIRGCTWNDDEQIVNYAWRNMLRISCDLDSYGKHFDKNAPMATVTSRGVGAFHAGCALSINATVNNSFASWTGISGDEPAKDKYGITQWSSFNNNLRVSLRIGTRWYTGDGWSDTETIFNIPAGIKTSEGYWSDRDDRASGQILNTKTIDMPWDGASGFIVPITETIFGQVAITFYPWIKNTPYASGNYDFTALFISDLKIDYYSASSNQDREGLRLTASTGKNFQDELNVALRLTSAKDDRIGHALLWFAGSPIGSGPSLTYPDNVSMTKPENWLMQTLLKIYSAPSTQLELEVEYDSNMRMWDMVSVDSKNYIITGMNIDYADEHMTLTLLNYE